MLQSERDRIRVTDRDPMKGPYISLWSDDVQKIELFKHLCRANLPHDLGWFHQSNTSKFQMFEFWKPQTEAMVYFAIAVHRVMELPMDISVDKDYRPVDFVRVPPLKPFNESLHTYGEFSDNQLRD